MHVRNTRVFWIPKVCWACNRIRINSLVRSKHCALMCFFELFLIKAYRLEPLILKHYSNISPVQIHWYNTSNPLPYEYMKPSFLHPAKEPTSIPENEGISTIPSPVTSPVLSRRHYGESITNIGKASILGNSS